MVKRRIQWLQQGGAMGEPQLSASLPRKLISSVMRRRRWATSSSRGINTGLGLVEGLLIIIIIRVAVVEEAMIWVMLAPPRQQLQAQGQEEEGP